MIRVVAILTAKPGRRAAVLEAFRANMPAVRAEQGCIEYGPTIDAEDAGRIQTRLGEDAIVVIETWESMAALAAHAKSPHMAAYGEKVKDLLASRVIHVLTEA